MNQVVVHKKNGISIRLFSYDGTSGITDASRTKEFRGEDAVTITLISAVIRDFEIGDYVIAFGERYTINELPQVEKVNDRHFIYTLRFEGLQYDLLKVAFLDLDADGFSTGGVFSLTGDLEDVLKMVIRNANRVYGKDAWKLGTVEKVTESKTMDFSDQSCLNVLQTVCNDTNYDVSFYIRTTTTGIVLEAYKENKILPDTFQYGRGRGLYQLKRQTVSDSSIVSRLFAYGSDRNIPADYRGGSLRLKMPVNRIRSEGQPYIEDAAAVSRYGIIESSLSFDDIYPHYEGAVTDIDGQNLLVFKDQYLPFDLNGSLLPGGSALVHFNSGNVAGYQFEIVGYDDNTKQFTIKAFTNEVGFEMPHTPGYTINVGDRYVILNIKLPDVYLREAEQKLYKKALSYLSEKSKPQVQWSLTFDERFIKKLNVGDNYFIPGMRLSVVDEDLGIDGTAVIQKVTRDLLYENRYEMSVGTERRKEYQKMINYKNLTDTRFRATK